MSGFIDKVYQHSPIFIQNLGVTYYGWKMYRREYGKKLERALAEFNARMWQTPEEVKRYQDFHLKELIKHCYDNVPYYHQVMQQRKLRPEDITTAEDLPKLPIITRDDVRHHSEELKATNFKPSQLAYGHTSGTTGSPVNFGWDKHLCFIKNVVDWRQKDLAGIHPGDRMAFLLGRQVAPLEQKKPPFWRHNLVLNQLFFSGFHMSTENLSSYVKKLRDFKAVAFEGYSSLIYILADYILAQSQTVPLKAVLTSSETLTRLQREVIEKAFACKVFDFYGLAERVAFAIECEAHNGKHLNPDFAIHEVLDSNDQAAPVGKLGRLVGTSLHNKAMPLLRYLTNDMVTLKGEPCSCGRKFPLIDDIASRIGDIIVAKNGRYITPLSISAATLHVTTITHHQVIQEEKDRIVVKVVKGEGYSDADSDFLLKELGRVFGEGMFIELDFVDNIPRTASGKYRWVISKLPPQI